MPPLLHHLRSHTFPLLHYLGVECVDTSDVRALTRFLPQCTNLRTIYCKRDSDDVVSESVEEEMWGAAVRRCKNLEEVRVGGDKNGISCDRLVSVLKKLSEKEKIQALKLRKIVKLGSRGQEEDYTKQVKHLLPALQQ